MSGSRISSFLRVKYGMKHCWGMAYVAQVPRALLLAMFATFVILVGKIIATESPVMASDEYAYFMSAKYEAVGQELYRYDPAMQAVDNRAFPLLFDTWSLVSSERVALVGRVFNGLVFVLSALVIFLISCRVFDRPTASISSILYLLFPFSFYSTILLPEVEFQFLVYATVLLVLWSSARRSVWMVLAPALASAAAYFVKPHAIALIVGVAGFFTFSGVLVRNAGMSRSGWLGVIRALIYLLSTGVAIYLVKRVSAGDSAGATTAVASFYGGYLQRLSSPGYLLENAWSIMDYIVGHVWVLLLLFAPGVLAIATECWRAAKALFAKGEVAAVDPVQLQHRRFAVLVAMLCIAFLVMIGAFTNSASQVSEFERYRLHGRYLEPMLPLLLAYSVWAVRKSARVMVMAGVLAASVLIFYFYLRFQYHIYPWDYPDIFVFFTSDLQHWGLAGVNDWMVWLVVAAALAFFACSFFGKFSTQAYVIYLALLMIGCHVQMGNWLRQSSIENKAMIEAGDMMNDYLAGAAPGSGLVLVDDRYGKSSYFLMELSSLQHVVSVEKGGGFSGEIPRGVEWIIAPSDVRVEGAGSREIEFGPQSLYRLDRAEAR